MNSREFESLISNPDLLKSINKSTLEQLVKDYPFFQSAYLLLAKNSQLNHDALFESKLNLAAAYAIDRKKLYELINGRARKYESTVVAEKIIQPSSPNEAASTSGNELDELLRSIHEKKQKILEAGVPSEKENLSSEINARDEFYLIQELKGSGSEFSPAKLELIEDPQDDLVAASLELEMMKSLEQEVNELEDYQRTGELLEMNETAGGGAEFDPLAELLSEEAEYAFVEEQDPEVESISVIEEEFILRDLDMEIKVKDIVLLSESETPIQVDKDNEAFNESIPDAELESMKEIEIRLEEEEAFHQQEIFETLNQEQTADLIEVEKPVEIHDDKNLLWITSPQNKPEDSDVIGSEKIISAGETGESAGDSLFRINQHVESPGIFLPGKSYSFIGWLQFFKPESGQEDKGVPKIKPLEEPDHESASTNIQITAGLQKELETIDRIIPMLKHESSAKEEFQLSPADLARKSLEMDEEIVTETLAQIYEVQGLFDKAIRMYAKLSLKYPEKSLFFAARIKELKSKK